MSRDKQIEEMANCINEMDEPNAHYYGRNMKEHEAFADCFTIAKHLYNAGYRKTSDIASEIFEEVGKLTNEYLQGKIYTHEFCTNLAELKKKHIGEDTNVLTNTEEEMPSPIDKVRLTRAQDRRAKVTEEQCEEMRVLYGEGIPQYVIAKKYGISQSAVSYIVSPKAHENLRKYRQINPPKRRTKEEARIYSRSLREYKRQFYKPKKTSEFFKEFKIYKFKKNRREGSDNTRKSNRNEKGN